MRSRRLRPHRRAGAPRRRTASCGGAGRAGARVDRHLRWGTGAQAGAGERNGRARSRRAGERGRCGDGRRRAAKRAARKGAKRKSGTSAETAAPAPTLIELTQRLQAAAATREAGDGDAPRAAFPQLAALDEFRMRFSRLRMDRQLRESLEPSSTDAGPLNSGRLVHRALSTMQALAPEYLQQFMAYVDALAWMERLGAGVGEAEEPAAAAGKRGRKRRE
nr:DUF2894 domain-containing protein [Lysobacter enzymogenes]